MLNIYNTASRQKEEFRPIDPEHVRMYVCGPTVYDFAHIGNARPVVVFDVVFRLLARLYPQVTYVRNITDVEDKINARAAELGEEIRTLTERTAKQFHDDVAALGALEPDVEPRATDHIEEMIAINSSLIDRGYAYHEDGHVLFHVPSMEDYGKLSGHSRDELIAGARVEVAPYKRDPADFVLWKPSDDTEPGWDSPWGRGRPGWHVECSAMSMKYLGTDFDIHGGGRDLIFPHHENEIAQSRCANPGSHYAKYWMHNGYLLAEGEKMSKSLGNFYTINELLQEFPGEAVRFVLLQTHYRQPLDFSKESVTQARHILDRFYGALRQVAEIDATPGDAADVVTALEDDINTPLAISAMHAYLGDLNKAEAPEEKARLKGLLLDGGRLLGVLQQDPEEWFRWQPPSESGLADAEIEDLIERRAAARASKDFAEADRIRDELAAAGILLEDKADGTIWRRG